jgi:hypothetical protein
MVEFYSLSVSKELKGEEAMGRHRLDGEMKKVGAAVWFGYSRVEESGRQWRMARRRGRRGGSDDQSRRWETTPWWAVPGRMAERSGPVSVGVMERRRWAERQNGPKAKEAAA